ncbi:Uncharacterized protein QTN25_000186 [Entamoeba marina]
MTEATETVKLCVHAKKLLVPILSTANNVNLNVGQSNIFETNKQELVQKVGELANILTTTNKEDYTTVEIESIQVVVTLAHLLYETVKSWSPTKQVKEEVSEKIKYLEIYIDKLMDVGKREESKKKIDILGEVAKQIGTGKGKSVKRELEKKGFDFNFDFQVAEARSRLVEARKKQEEALKAVEKVYDVFSPVKEDWSKDDFIKQIFGDYANGKSH